MVPLRADLRFRVAPRFHRRAAWSERLALSSAWTSAQGQLVAGDQWRAPEASELERLLASPETAGASGAASSTPTAEAALLALPQHLRRTFWEAAATSPLASDAGGEAAASSAGLAAFARTLLEFLRFKELALPDPATAAVFVAREGERSTRYGAGRSAPRGIEFDRESETAGRLRVATNLGDEATHLVFLNLTAAALAAWLDEARHPDAASTESSPAPRGARRPPYDLVAAATRDFGPAALRELRLRFAERGAPYPLVRVRLEPGEGLVLPPLDVAHDGWTIGQREPQIIAVVGETPAVTPSRA